MEKKQKPTGMFTTICALGLVGLLGYWSTKDTNYQEHCKDNFQNYAEVVVQTTGSVSNITPENMAEFNEYLRNLNAQIKECPLDFQKALEDIAYTYHSALQSFSSDALAAMDASDKNKSPLIIVNSNRTESLVRKLREYGLDEKYINGLSAVKSAVENGYVDFHELPQSSKDLIKNQVRTTLAHSEVSTNKAFVALFEGI